MVWDVGHAQAPNWLHTEGSQIVDAAGNPVILTGINWFGLETESYAPHGLWARNWESILDQVVELGFNTIRLPYSNQLFDPSSQPNGVNQELNPDLKGLSGLEIMDKIIAGAGQRGLKVILDRHRPDSHAQSELWYTSQYSEDRWIADWVMLAERYAGDDTVIGVDLHNEPHGQATWGSDDPATDWRLAAEKAGNAILKVNPNLLIVVQGVEQYQGDWYWWGGNLMGVREQPVRLDHPAQLVYSTHVYGPGVYPQAWFSDPTFPDNMPEIWDRHWGFLSRENISPVIVGEFGGRSVGEDKEGIWQRALVDYLRQHNFSYFYWTLNPNSGDTGGILLDDWQSVDPEKEALLSQYQFPMIGIEQSGQAPATRMAPTTPLASATASPPSTPVALALETGALQVTYRTANPSAQTRDSKPEFILRNNGKATLPLSRVELRYWLSPEDTSKYVFHCDWAAIGCANLTGEFLVSETGYPYLSLHFGDTAGALLAGQDSGEIKLRFNRGDWSEYPQEGHYSFSPSIESTGWEQVTAYVDGKLVWGLEPGSAPPPTPTIAPSEALPSPTVIPSESAPVAPPTGTALSTAPPRDSDWITPALYGVIFASGMWILILAVGRTISLRRNGKK